MKNIFYSIEKMSKYFCLLRLATAFLMSAMVCCSVAAELPNDSSLWARWWSYSGISGPKYWGLLNSQWRLCSEGRRQSPINIKLEKLLYDPSIKILRFSGGTTAGVLRITGNDVVIDVSEGVSKPTYISKGPLSYRYQVFQVRLHYNSDTSLIGSEHRINNLSFPVELQIIGFNIDLYKNWSEAETLPHGLVAVAIFVQVGTELHKKFNTISRSIEKLRYKDHTLLIKGIHLPGLLPNTSEYITYDGSQTQPGCHETVSWIIMNKPIYISRRQLIMLRGGKTFSRNDQRIYLSDNIRPLQPVNGRSVRTNIHINKGCKQNHPIIYEMNRRYEV